VACGISVPAIGGIGDNAGNPGAARHAVATDVLTISPAKPRAGQLYRVTGRTKTRAARPVRLEVLDQRGAWRAKSRAVTARSGTFRFSWSSDRSQRLRVVAPRVARAHGRAALPRWVSRVVRVVPRSPTSTPTPTPTPTPKPSSTPSPTPTAPPVAQTVALAAPPFALEQQHATLTASVAPSAPGRGVVLQRRDGSAWTAVASASTDAAGAASFVVDTAGAGSVAYRAVAEASAGVLQGVSEPVAVEVRAGLPRVDITTNDQHEIGDSNGDGHIDGSDDKFAYAPGRLAIDPRGSGVPAYQDDPGQPGKSRFRVRGNATAFVLIKLSYKVKLDKKAALLGLPKSKDWVLLANFYDRSMLRTDLAFEASRRVGLAWTPTMVSVELWQNGRYAGVYQLGEGIEVDKDRVDIDVPDVTAPGFDPTSSVDGGYLLEADYRNDTDPQFSTSHGLKLHLKEPQGEDFASQADTDIYLDGVRDSTQALEDALYSAGFTDPADGYRKYVDVPSFINWYLVNELMKNHDSAFTASVWFYRDRGGKLAMGPAWDFDQSSGARTDLGLGDPTGWFLRKNWYPASGVTMMSGPQGHWLNRMFEDPWFVDQVELRWEQLRADLLTLPSYLEDEAADLAPAAARNFAPPWEGGAWMPIGGTFLEPDGIFFGSWGATVDNVHDWLSDRLAWMDGQLHPGA
jgi:hypothetical protein